MTVQRLPVRMQHMLDTHGRTDGCLCRDCAFLVHGSRRATWPKCARMYKTTAPNDWRPTWPACGLWQNRHLGVTDAPPAQPERRQGATLAELWGKP